MAVGKGRRNKDKGKGEELKEKNHHQVIISKKQTREGRGREGTGSTTKEERGQSVYKCGWMCGLKLETENEIVDLLNKF